MQISQNYSTVLYSTRANLQKSYGASNRFYVDLFKAVSEGLEVESANVPEIKLLEEC
jgi:hypothetical protein